jgi:pilus assembly protein CpaF
MLTDRSPLSSRPASGPPVDGFAGQPGWHDDAVVVRHGELDPALRVVIAEDVFEADKSMPDVTQIQIRAPRVDRPAVYPRRLLAGFRRMSPDLAIVDQVREREALPELLSHADTLPTWERSVALQVSL